MNHESVEKRKRGRPGGDVIRTKNYRLSFSDDEYDRAENLSRLTGKTKAQIFREAFRIYENLELAKIPDAGYDDFDSCDDDFY